MGEFQWQIGEKKKRINRQRVSTLYPLPAGAVSHSHRLTARISAVVEHCGLWAFTLSGWQASCLLGYVQDPTSLAGLLEPLEPFAIGVGISVMLSEAPWTAYTCLYLLPQLQGITKLIRFTRIYY